LESLGEGCASRTASHLASSGDRPVAFSLTESSATTPRNDAAPDCPVCSPSDSLAVSDKSEGTGTRTSLQNISFLELSTEVNVHSDA
jgi:hypothetical protein